MSSVPVVFLFRVHQLRLLLWIWAYPLTVFMEGEEKESASISVVAGPVLLSIYRDMTAC